MGHPPQACNLLLQSAAQPQAGSVAAGAESRSLRKGCRAGELPADGDRVMRVAAEANRLAALGPPPPKEAGIEPEPAAGVDLQGAAAAGQRAQRRPVLVLEVGAPVWALAPRPVPGR
jgi:hypothetical protein